MAKQLQDKGKELAEQARDQALDALGLEQQHSHFWSNLGWLLLGAGLGALTAYLMDPDRGRRRQALVRDQVVHARKVVQREVPKRIRYAQGQLQGMQHGLGLNKSGQDDGSDAESPSWEERHNDEGSLTTPTT